MNENRNAVVVECNDVAISRVNDAIESSLFW